MPFQEPHATYEFLKELADRRPGSTVVFADDGEKFGSWPKTFDHVYTQGWLNRFCDMLRGQSRLDRDDDVRAGRRQLASAGQGLPARRLVSRDDRMGLASRVAASFRRGAERLAQLPDAGDIKRFFRAGGYWRNFKARYPETDEMYARMLGVSRRLAAAEAQPRGRPRLPGNRPPGALSRTVQLSLLAWVVRRPLLCPT